MDWRSFYEDRYGAKHTGHLVRSVSFRDAEYDRIDRTIRAIYGVTSSTRVLDIGAGYANYLASAEVTALDISESALTMSPRAIKVQGSAENLPFSDSAFDLVVCSQVLEHVPNWRAALLEMRRVLRSGGMLFLAVPNTFALMKRRFHELERTIDRAGHINEFREAELYFALMSCGFENIDSQGACYDMFWLGARLERSRFAGVIVPILDRIPTSILARALFWESQRRRRRLNGLSLEMWCFKP